MIGGIGVAVAMTLLPAGSAWAGTPQTPNLTTQPSGGTPASVGALPVDTTISSPPSAAFPLSKRIGTTCTFPNVTGPSGEVIKHVAPCQTGTGDGSATNPWRNIVQAMANLGPGQVAYVHGDDNIATTDYNEANLSPGSDGTGASSRIRLMAAPDEQPMIKPALINGNKVTTPIFNLNRPWWIIDGWSTKVNGVLKPGLIVDATNVAFQTEVVRVGATDHVVLRGITSQNGRGPKSFFSFSGASNSALLDSFVTDPLLSGRPTPAPLSGDESDHHGIEVKGTASKILIRGNDSYGHNGDSFQCGEAAGPLDVTVESNRFHEDEENAVDIKGCSRVTIRGNKLFGYRPARPGGADGGRAPHGDAIVVHHSTANGDVPADRVLIEKNRMWDNSRNLDLSAYVDKAVVRRNVIFNSSTAECGMGAGMVIAAKNAEVYQNTLDNMTAQTSPPPVGCHNWGDSETSALYVTPADGSRIVLWNNIVSNATRPYAGWTDSSTPARDKFDARTNMFPIGATTIPVGSWAKDPLWVANPLVNDYYTQQGSEARDVATLIPATVSDPDAGLYCDDPYGPEGDNLIEPDIGFLESCN
jgi:hypothetical protein